VGAPGAPEVFFWHSLGPQMSGAAFATVGGRLADRGFHVTAVDAPGFGASPELPESEYALSALVERAAEIAPERCVFVGHSWGGAVAVHYAATHPERVASLVLLDSGHIDYGDIEEEAPTAEQVEARWREAGVLDDATASPSASAKAMSGLLTPVSISWPTLAARRIPTLLLLATLPPHGDQNREHAPRFAAAVPHAEIRWLDGVSHSVLADVGPDLGDDMADWIQLQS
jgi:pimeloyl-ACP methyl ester carboxylesterase